MNVVLVTVDSLRADHVGFLSPESAPDTPTIDAIAEDALVFENAFANAPYTRASFPAILTGTYSEMHGGYRYLSDDRPSLAETFDEAGYATGGFHSNPYLSAQFNYDRGFDRLFSGVENESLLAKVRRYLAQKVPRDSTPFAILQTVRTKTEAALGTELGTPYVPGDELNEQVVHWLDDVDEPVFLWVHYMDVHHPYIPHEGTVSGGIDRSRAIELREKMIAQSVDLSETEVTQLKRLYRGEVEFVDRCIAELLEAIEHTLSLSETVVGFLADHGEAFGEHDYWGHPDELHDELLRIPFALDVPTRDGGRVSTPVSTVDLFPTLMDLHEWTAPDSCVGDSVLQYSGEEPNSDDRYLFAQASGTKAMVCNGQYKLIRYFESGEEALFDRVEDPAERDDQLVRKPDVRDELAAVLDERLSEIDERQESTVDDVEMTEDVERRLEQLGYK